MAFELKYNADRFSGFADEYDKYRPKCPQFVADTLINYLGYNPNTVVDLGCGTGLSTVIWSNFSKNVIGVEPNPEMQSIAKANSKDNQNINFINAFAHATGLDSHIADIITCSQSFHWMEPTSTLKEINRLLKPGGIFAAYDCDWPPVIKWQVEDEYEKLFNIVSEIEEKTQLKNTYNKWNKNKHMQNITDSGYFRYTREIVFNNTEICDADRFIGLAISQGGLQSVIKNKYELIKPHLERFIDKTNSELGSKTHKIDFCYRMRIGIK